MDNHQVDLEINTNSSSTDDYNPMWKEHKAKAKKLLSQGFWGFLGGFFFILITMGFISGFINEYGFFAVIVAGLIVGFICAGFPLGWQILNKIVGGWAIWGNIIIVIALFMFKVSFSIMIGSFALPVTLIYHAINSQRSKRKIKRAYVIIAVLFALYIVFAAAILAREYASAPLNNNAETTTPVVHQVVSVESFSSESGPLKTLLTQSISGTQESEYEDITDYGWKVTTPTTVLGVFFLEAKNPEDPPCNILKNLTMHNAVVIIAGYFVEKGSGFNINEWETSVWFYPNFSYSDDGTLLHEVDEVYFDSIRVPVPEDALEWLTSEYNGMTVTEIKLP